ncbi:MAG: pitrilysin family protein [Terriglobia bacterium]
MMAENHSRQWWAILAAVMGFLILLFSSSLLGWWEVSPGILSSMVLGFSNSLASPSPSDMSSAINEIKLSNGLKILLEEQHTLPIVSIGMWYRIGSKDDPSGLEGVSSLTQELTYRSSRLASGNQMIRVLDESGGHWAGHTLRDQSCFLATVPKAKVQEILELEAARMTITSFPDESVEKEKGILLDRILSLNDDPRRMLDFEVSATAFRLHPYRWPREGLAETVQKLTSEQVWHHYSRYYAPNNAILVVVGDVDAKQLLPQIEKLFGKMERKSDPPHYDFREPFPTGERRVKLNRQGNIPYLEIAYPAPHILNDDFFALLMIDAILSGSNGIQFPLSSRPPYKSADSWLQKAVVEKKLATQFSTQLLPTEDSYLYKVTLTLSDQFQYQAAEEAFSELLEKLRSYEVEEKMMERIRSQILSTQNLDQGDYGARAVRLGYLESIATYKLFSDLETKIKSLTGQDLNRVASKYLRDEARTVGWEVPIIRKPILKVEKLQGENRRALPDSRNYPLPVQNNEMAVRSDQSRSQVVRPVSFPKAPGNSSKVTQPRLYLDGWHPSQFWNPLPLYAGAKFNAFPEVQGSSAGVATENSGNNSGFFKMERQKLASGATLIALENRASPMVTVCAVIRTGAASDLEGREGTAMFVGRMLDHGLTVHGGTRVLDNLAKNQARLDVETGYLATTITLEGPSSSVTELIQLLSDLIQGAIFTQFQMESVRAELLAEVREADYENKEIFHRLLREKIYPAGHPYRRPIGGTVTSIERMRLTDLDSFYKKYFRPNLVSLIVVGDIELQEIRNQVEKAFSSWKVKSGEERPSIPELTSAVDSSTQVVTIPGKSTCSVGFGVPGVDARHPDFLAIMVANQILGKGRSSRLLERIREQEGLTGDVRSGFVGSSGEGPLLVGGNISLVKLDSFVAGIRSELERLQKDGISAAELELVKKSMINDYWVALSSNRGLAQAFVFSEANQLGSEYVSSFPDALSGLTSERVSEAARKYLDFELGPKVIVGPYESK